MNVTDEIDRAIEVFGRGSERDAIKALLARCRSLQQALENHAPPLTVVYHLGLCCDDVQGDATIGVFDSAERAMAARPDAPWVYEGEGLWIASVPGGYYYIEELELNKRYKDLLEK